MALTTRGGRRRSGRCLPVLVAGLTVAAAIAAAPTSAAPEATAADGAGVVRVAQLPRGGPEARVPWLAGNVLHTARGTTLTMPWTGMSARKRGLTLVGRSVRGWLLHDSSESTSNLWLVKGGERTLLSSPGVSEGDSYDFAVSADGRRILVRYFDGDRRSSLFVRGLGGKILAKRGFPGLPGLLAFSGPELVVGSSPAQVWTVDGDTLENLGVDAVGADLARDLLFATDADGTESGPTRLSDPGVPGWSAAMAQPVVCPGGGRVLSRDRADGDVLTVRSLATGHVRTSLQVRFVASEAPVWENNHAFVFVGTAGGLGDREALVRCSLSGRCVRVSGFRARGLISLPR